MKVEAKEIIKKRRNPSNREGKKMIDPKKKSKGLPRKRRRFDRAMRNV